MQPAACWYITIFDALIMLFCVPTVLACVEGAYPRVEFKSLQQQQLCVEAVALHSQVGDGVHVPNHVHV